MLRAQISVIFRKNMINFTYQLNLEQKQLAQNYDVICSLKFYLDFCAK